MLAYTVRRTSLLEEHFNFLLKKQRFFPYHPSLIRQPLSACYNCALEWVESGLYRTYFLAHCVCGVCVHTLKVKVKVKSLSRV